MKDTLTIFSALAKNWFRSKGGMFFSFMFPLMLLLIFGTIFGGEGSTTYTLHVQNRDLVGEKPTELSRSFIDVLEDMDTFEVENLDPDIDIENYVKVHPSFSTYRILVIPENFQREAMNKNIYVRTGVILDTLKIFLENYGHVIGDNQVGDIENGMNALKAWREGKSADGAEVLLLSSGEGSSAGVVRGIISNVTNSFNNRMMAAGEVVEVETGEIAQRKLDPVDYYLPGYIAAFIMTNGIMGVTTNTSEFRRNGVIKRLAATPLRKRSWILGNLIHQTLLAIMLMIVMIVVGWAIFGVTAIPDVYAFALIAVGAAAFTGVGLVLGGIIEDVEAANSAGSAIGFPMMFLSGAFFPVDMMPDFMQTVARIMPVYYFHEGLRQIMIYRNPSQSMIPFAILGIFALIFVYLAVRVTKWREW